MKPMLTSLLLLVAANGATQAQPAPTAPIAEPNPKTMSGKEIREHNAKLARSHPFFIRCVKLEATGSLVKGKASCRTNQQWAAADEAGNREARDIADRMASKAGNSN
jgi:hypothetical protein